MLPDQSRVKGLPEKIKVPLQLKREWQTPGSLNKAWNIISLVSFHSEKEWSCLWIIYHLNLVDFSSLFFFSLLTVLLSYFSLSQVLKIETTSAKSCWLTSLIYSNKISSDYFHFFSFSISWNSFHFSITFTFWLGHRVFFLTMHVFFNIISHSTFINTI